MRWIMRTQREDDPARSHRSLALIRVMTGATSAWALARIVNTNS
jgi:hypothetical protein